MCEVVLFSVVFFCLFEMSVTLDETNIECANVISSASFRLNELSPLFFLLASESFFLWPNLVS